MKEGGIVPDGEFKEQSTPSLQEQPHTPQADDRQ